MDFRTLILFAHIAAGVVSLITMVIAYTTKKGPKAHAKVGRIYGYGMVGVGLTAVVLFFMGASTFLLLIAFLLNLSCPRRMAFCFQQERRSYWN